MKTKLPFLLVFALILNSCIGVSMDIQMRRDGSGRISMGYRISNMAETIGRLDGNENWPVVPLGRDDFIRTVERIEGMHLVSFSARQAAQDLIIEAKLEYDNIEALSEFLDPFKTRVSLNQRAFDIILFEPGASRGIDTNLMEMARPFFDGYNFEISFSADSSSAMAITDGSGNEIPAPPAAQVVQSGRKVSLSAGMAEILFLTSGLGVQIRW